MTPHTLLISVFLAIQIAQNPTPPLVENCGQFAEETQYCLQSKSQKIHLNDQGMSIAQVDGALFQLQFVGAQGPLAWRGLCNAGSTHNYCAGAAEDWVLNAIGWTSVAAVFREGIELRMEAADQKFKYSFHLEAGVAPQDLILNFSGAEDVEIMADGGLKISQGESHIFDAAPVAWQVGADGKDYVDVAFELLTTPGQVALRVGDYDPTRPLIVDPEMLLFCGFLGGGLKEEGRGIGVDSRGDLFITGFTESPDLPVHNAW
ncbi:MAG: hypothetical protein HQ519_08095, partial [Planctomycetes bacterium]|nr:hypothetical protein [Planctomycetota bacterium]